MKERLFVLVLFTLPLAFAAEPSPPPTPHPKKAIHVCDPYAERCPACVDCSRCKACSKEGNRCSVKRAQLGMQPR